ncbi:DUF2165 domain-containing protein [Pseudomonas sp. MDT1-16]|uniref:DUF2165 domain-containing protein n=1 Tax=Pseudomonas sp. AL03 TaxID=3042230 RepID=UPI00249A6B7B|nr:DUF2165 domain-containing protein [Pseudomonas sp. AL03]MDI3271029.1 DUF2165 domain-containing protein [Pseudomonas sp. AL03]
MNNLTTNQTIRISKIALMSFISFFGLLMMYSNLADYPTNYEYVAHILSMDTTSDQSKYGLRAITSPMLQHRIYWIIITLEVIYTLLCLMGTYQLYRNLSASADDFHEAKKYALMGLLVAIFVYYICIQVVGVEWFNMDQSDVWNYDEWAQKILSFTSPTLIYISLRTEE